MSTKRFIAAVTVVLTLLSVAQPVIAATQAPSGPQVGGHINVVGGWVPDHCDVSTLPHKLFLPMVGNLVPADINSVPPGGRTGGCI